MNEGVRLGDRPEWPLLKAPARGNPLSGADSIVITVCCRTEKNLYYPQGVAADANGNIPIADSSNGSGRVDPAPDVGKPILLIAYCKPTMEPLR